MLALASPLIPPFENREALALREEEGVEQPYGNHDHRS